MSDQIPDALNNIIKTSTFVTGIQARSSSNLFEIIFAKGCLINYQHCPISLWLFFDFVRILDIHKISRWPKFTQKKPSERDPFISPMNSQFSWVLFLEGYLGKLGIYYCQQHSKIVWHCINGHFLNKKYDKHMS